MTCSQPLPMSKSSPICSSAPEMMPGVVAVEQAGDGRDERHDDDGTGQLPSPHRLGRVSCATGPVHVPDPSTATPTAPVGSVARFLTPHPLPRSGRLPVRSRPRRPGRRLRRSRACAVRPPRSCSSARAGRVAALPTGVRPPRRPRRGPAPRWRALAGAAAVRGRRAADLRHPRGRRTARPQEPGGGPRAARRLRGCSSSTASGPASSGWPCGSRRPAAAPGRPAPPTSRHCPGPGTP